MTLSNVVEVLGNMLTWESCSESPRKWTPIVKSNSEYIDCWRSHQGANKINLSASHSLMPPHPSVWWINAGGRGVASYSMTRMVCYNLSLKRIQRNWLNLGALQQWVSKCGPGPAASAPRGNLLEMHIPDLQNQKLFICLSKSLAQIWELLC